MVIKINYTSSDVYVSTSVSPVYVVVNYSGTTTGAAVWGQITGTLSDQTDLQTALDDKVPYTGATTNVNLGEFELKAGQVEFDQTPTGAAGVAVMRWNDSDGTVDLGLKGGNVTLQVGQEQILRVVNKTGANLLESQYRAVRIRLAAEGGSQGQRLAVVLAQGNNDTNSTDTIGIVTENITDNQEGFICTSGIVRGINTTGSLQGETWADGDVIYLSPTIPGAITKVKPTAPDHSVVLGYVIYAHNVNGKIFVKCETGYEIGELHDVYVPTPSNNDGIFWNTANSRYQNNSIAGVLGYTPISGSGASGQVAYWNGTSSQTGSNNLFWDAANARLGIGTNTPARALDVRGAARIETASTTELDLIAGGGNIVRLASSATTPFIGTLTSAPFGFITAAVERARVSTNGNLLVGTTSDGGQRLQVMGDAFIRGSGATSATTALTVQNSGGSTLFTMRNDGVFELGGVLAGPFMYPITTTNSANLSGTNFGFLSLTTTQPCDLGTYSFNGSNMSQTSGAVRNVHIYRNFVPTSGNATYSVLSIFDTINQTGGANGITRGLYVNPTLTAAADWRSIEWSNNSGWGLYGAGTANNYLAGSLGIGTTSPSRGLRIGLTPTAADSSSNFVNVVIPSSVTSAYRAFGSSIGLNSSGFTLPNLSHFEAIQDGAFTAGVVTNHYGFRVNALISGTNVFGFHSNLASATNVWNLYMSGTADNYLAGKLLIGTTTVSTFALDVNGTARVSGVSTFGGTLNINTAAWLQFNGANTLLGEGTNTYLQANGSGSIIFRNNTPSELIRITSGGNVGIATTNPGYKLDVNGSARAGGLTLNAFATGTAGGNLELGYDGAQGVVQAYNRTVPAWIPLYLSGSMMTFNPGGVEKFRITSTGNVGIGKSNPNQLLHVNGAIEAGPASVAGGAMIYQAYSSPNYLGSIGSEYSNGAMLIGYGATGKNGASGYVSTFDNFSSIRGLIRLIRGEFSILSTISAVNTAIGADLTMTTNFVVTSEGNVGIGTTSPNAVFEVANGAIRTSFLPSGNAFLEMYSGGSAGYIEQKNANPLVTIVNGAERMRITSGGNLLVGTTVDNGSKFQVSGAATFSSSVTATDLIGVDTLNITANNVNTNGTVLTLNSRGTVGVMAFQTASTERMRLNSSGNLGLGTTSPSASAILDVTSTTKGFLPPRMTNAQRTAISSPAVGLMVYQTDSTEGTYEYISSGWRIINGGGGGSVDEQQVSLICQVFG